MEGFFTKKETESISRPDGKVYSCTICGLFKDCIHPKMEPFGNFKKRILNIGEAPGEVEDQRGRQWQGRTGRLLQNTYKHLGIDLFDDCLNINAVNCRPPNNSSPDSFQIGCCRKRILNTIEQYKPKLIMLFGNAAVSSVIGHRWRKELGGIMKWRGWTIPDQDFKAWICPTFHPSYVERTNAQEVDVIWENDIKQAFELLDVQFPVHKDPDIEIIDDLKVLNDIKDTTIAFDYETTGRKPHATGHRIVCASVADTINHCYAFLIPNTKEGRQPFIDLLKRKSVGKVAHSMKFEEAWSIVRLKTSVTPWELDTMIMAHILDNRPGVTSLKFQVYVNFGIVDYASDIAPYLQATENNNGNAINKIFDLLKRHDGKNKLLKYCAYDAIYGLRLAKHQLELLLPF